MYPVVKNKFETKFSSTYKIILEWYIHFRLMYAEVVTFVVGSLEAGGLPGYPEVF